LQMNIKRGMDIDTRCPVCWRLNEDGGHCFLKCKFAVHCWREALLEDVRSLLLQKASAYEVVTTILSLNDDTCLEAASLIYAWWEARNKANSGEGVRQTSQVVQHATMLAVQTKPTREKEINKPPQPQRWTRPLEGLLKANCDGSFFSESKKRGWGFIIRDHQGRRLLQDQVPFQQSMMSNAHVWRLYRRHRIKASQD
jgi:hypothetical protein